MTAPVDVLAAIDAILADPGVRISHAAKIHEIRAAVAELIEAAGRAQDTNRDDFALMRPDVSGLPESERATFLRGWDAASEAVYRTGLRAALARCKGGAA